MTGDEVATEMLSSRYNNLCEDFDGEGYDEEFKSQLGSVYDCAICLLTLREPMQTTCGHRFCKRCILKAVRGGLLKCPVDNLELTEEDLFPDNFAKKEVLCLAVYCRHFRSKGCPWIGQLQNLRDHLEACQYEVVICPNNCGELVVRGNLESHKASNCGKRSVQCLYCGVQISFCQREHHESICPEFPISCPLNCGITTLVRSEADDHSANCPNVIVTCPFKLAGCTFQDRRVRLDTHLSSELNNHLASICVRLVDISDKIDNHVKPITASETMQNKVVELNAMVVSAEKRLSDFNSSVRDGLLSGEAIPRQLSQLQADTSNKLQTLSDKVDANEASLAEIKARLWNGRFVWTIANMDGLLERSGREEVAAFHSQPFYTAHPGYKMCLRLNIGGVDSEGGDHLALFVHMMQGEFDALLAWPFVGRFALTIVDQATNAMPKNITEILIAKPGLQAFVRPSTLRNHKGYGYVEMVHHSVLRTRNYIKDGRMVIHVDAVVNAP